MTPEEMSAKMAALYEDDDFSGKAASCNNVQEMAELFVKEGVPITPEALELVLAKANEEGEISEEALESVAGGRIRWIPLPFPFPFPIPVPRPRWPQRW